MLKQRSKNNNALLHWQLRQFEQKLENLMGEATVGDRRKAKLLLSRLQKLSSKDMARRLDLLLFEKTRKTLVSLEDLINKLYSSQLIQQMQRDIEANTNAANTNKEGSADHPIDIEEGGEMEKDEEQVEMEEQTQMTSDLLLA